MKLTSVFGAALLGLALAACGGGSNSSGMTTPQPPPPPPPPPPPTLDPQYRVSAASPFAANCDGVPAAGTLYTNAEVEPSLAINPTNPQNIVAAWQQDRWSSGGARGIVAAASMDGGKTWTQQPIAFSRCGGGEYERASDAWLSAAPNGTLHQIAIAFSGGLLQPGSVSAVVTSRSTDGGMSWSQTYTLIRDTGNFFNDKCTITADPVTPHFVYAVWDRLVSEIAGPTAFARSADDGATWSAARTIYDPGATNQTISNQIVVLPNGALINLFLEIDTAANNTFSSALKVVRSTDNGDTWSAPFKIADNLAVGVRDPDTGVGVRDGSLVPQIAVAPSGDLYAVWQDARFSNGAHDGIALAHSSDGGMTWSAPARVNSDGNVAAFVPNVHVRADGQVGVSYFDFRPNTSSTATLLTNYWLARSSNGANWSESQIAGPFDLALAPLSAGADAADYFVGDYQALLSSGNVFMPLFAQTNAANTSNRTDIFLAPAVSATGGVAAAVQHAQAAENFVVTAELLRRASDNIARAREAPPRARASVRRVSRRH